MKINRVFIPTRPLSPIGVARTVLGSAVQFLRRIFLDRDLYEWILWEQERLRILSEWEQWDELLVRVEGLPTDVPIQFQQQASVVNHGLDGVDVRLPSYLLPLEFYCSKVTEFVLVPYFVACIHVPPPPPNQIVHVKTEEAYTLDGGLYTPVWVNGLMKTEQSQSNLNFVDGSSNIPSSYALEAISVEPYE